MGDNVPEVIMMMRYPASLGVLGEEELDYMFRAIRGSGKIVDKNCTFGAAMTTCDGNICPMVPLHPPIPKQSHVSSLVSKYEGMEKRSEKPSRSSPSSSVSSASSGSSGSWSETTKGFYLKSARPYCKELSPAIVVEIYIRLIDIHKDKDFVPDVCTCIKGAIKDHILAQRNITDQKIQFLISKPLTVYTLPL